MILIRHVLHPPSFPGSRRLSGLISALKFLHLPCRLSNLLTPPTSRRPCPNSPVTHISSLTSPGQWQPGSDWHRQPQVTGLETYHQQAACKDWEGQRCQFHITAGLLAHFCSVFNNYNICQEPPKGAVSRLGVSHKKSFSTTIYTSRQIIFYHCSLLSITVWNWITHLMEYSTVAFQFGWSYRALERQRIKAELWEDAANRGARCNATLVLTVN